jgi:hypothetical protein
MGNIVNIGPKGSKLDYDNWGVPITNAVNQLWNLVVQKPQVASSFSASSAVGTSATAVLTIPGCVLQAKTAYSVENIGGVFGSTTNFADFSLFKTNTAGTQIAALYRTPCFGAPQMNCYGKVYLRNDTTTDITFDLVLAVTASTGTVTHDASSMVGNRPRALVVTNIGTSTEYSFAFAVT